MSCWVTVIPRSAASPFTHSARIRLCIACWTSESYWGSSGAGGFGRPLCAAACWMAESRSSWVIEPSSTPSTKATSPSGRPGSPRPLVAATRATAPTRIRARTIASLRFAERVTGRKHTDTGRRPTPLDGGSAGQAASATGSRDAETASASWERRATRSASGASASGARSVNVLSREL